MAITKIGSTTLNNLVMQPGNGLGLGLGINPKGQRNRPPRILSKSRSRILPNIFVINTKDRKEEDDAPRLSDVIFGTTGGAVATTAMSRLFTQNNKYLRPIAILGGTLGFLGTTKYRDTKLPGFKKKAYDLGFTKEAGWEQILAMVVKAGTEALESGAGQKAVAATRALGSAASETSLGQKALKYAVRDAENGGANLIRAYGETGKIAPILKAGVKRLGSGLKRHGWDGKLNKAFMGLGMFGGESVGGAIAGNVGGMTGLHLGGQAGRAIMTKILPKTEFFGKKALIGAGGIAGGFKGATIGRDIFHPIGDKLVPIKPKKFFTSKYKNSNGTMHDGGTPNSAHMSTKPVRMKR